MGLHGIGWITWNGITWNSVDYIERDGIIWNGMGLLGMGWDYKELDGITRSWMVFMEYDELHGMVSIT
jgi:hypothetical protein